MLECRPSVVLGGERVTSESALHDIVAVEVHESVDDDGAAVVPDVPQQELWHLVDDEAPAVPLSRLCDSKLEERSLALLLGWSLLAQGSLRLCREYQEGLSSHH